MQEIQKKGLSRNVRALLVVIGGCITLMFTGGSIYGASSMTVAPAAERFGVDIATTGMYSSFWAFGLLIGAIIGGRVLTRFNLGGSAILGGIIGACGLALMGYAPVLPLYYFGAFLTGFPIAIAGPSLLQTALSSWFYKGRATVIGIVGMTEAIGTTTVSFFTAKMLAGAAGQKGALLVSAVLLFVGNLITGLFCFKGTPEDFGYTAVGQEGVTFEDQEGDATKTYGLTRAEAFKKSYFWAFLIASLILNMAYGILYPQISPYTQSIGFSTVQAATCVSAWSWGKSTSKIPYGLVADKFGLRTSLVGFTFLGFLASVVFTYFAGNNLGLLIVCSYGIGILGGITGAGTLTVSRMVGPREFFKMALLPHAANCIGYLIAPFIFRAIYVGTVESYRTAFTVCLGILVVYMVILWWSLDKKNMLETEGTL